MNNKEIFDTLLANKIKSNHNFPIACWGYDNTEFLSERLRENNFELSIFDFSSVINHEKIKIFKESQSNKTAIIFSEIQNASPVQKNEICNAILNFKFYDIELKEECLIFLGGLSVNDADLPRPIISRSINIDLEKNQ